MLEKTLESPLDCKEIQPVSAKRNQPWIFIGRTGAEAETPIPGHLWWKADSLEKSLMLGKIEGRRRRGRQKMRWLEAINNSMDMSLSKFGSWWWTGKPGVLQSMGSQRVRHDWVTEMTELRRTYCMAQVTLLNTLLTYMGKQSRQEWIYVNQIHCTVRWSVTYCK